MSAIRRLLDKEQGRRYFSHREMKPQVARLANARSWEAATSRPLRIVIFRAAAVVRIFGRQCWRCFMSRLLHVADRPKQGPAHGLGAHI